MRMWTDPVVFKGLSEADKFQQLAREIQTLHQRLEEQAEVLRVYAESQGERLEALSVKVGALTTKDEIREERKALGLG